MCLLGYSTDGLVAKVVINGVELVLAILFVENGAKTHIFSWEDKLVSGLRMRFNQVENILLTGLHLWRDLILRDAQNRSIEVAASSFKSGNVISLLQLHITEGVPTIDAHVDPKVGSVVVSIVKEAHAEDLIALGSEVEIVDVVGDDFSPQINHVFLLVLLLVGYLVQLEVQLAFVDSHELGLIVAASNRIDTLLGELAVKISWEDHVGAH